MSSKHLDDLRKIIESKRWIIVSEEYGDDLSISAVWTIGNREGKTVRLIFEGMGDLSVLPVEESYACYAEGDKSRTLYFGKNNKVEWKKNLMKFADELKTLFVLPHPNLQ